MLLPPHDGADLWPHGVHCKGEREGKKGAEKVFLDRCRLRQTSSVFLEYSKCCPKLILFLPGVLLWGQQPYDLLQERCFLGQEHSFSHWHLSEVPSPLRGSFAGSWTLCRRSSSEHPLLYEKRTPRPGYTPSRTCSSQGCSDSFLLTAAAQNGQRSPVSTSTKGQRTQVRLPEPPP